MAHALTDETGSSGGRPAKAMDAILGSRALLPSLAVLLTGALLFFAYAVLGYMDADCYEKMRKTGLVAETAELFDDIGTTLGGLRKGSAAAPKWSDPAFQDAVKEAQAVVSAGRRALREREPSDALDAIVDLQKILARAKSLATNRVNDILRLQDPADHGAFEKYRLEGQMLVAIVRDLDSALLTLGNRTQDVPGTCHW
jgi:hypothetical protein